MNTLANPTLSLPLRRPAQAPAPATRTAIDLQQRLEGGSLRLVLPDNSQLLLGQGAERATLQVNDERVFRRVLAEVRNTFGDHHNYLVAHADQRPITAADTLTARKIFHVSPFFPVNGEYRFRFDLSPERRRVELDYWLDGERVLATALQGVPQTLDAPAARRALLRQPLLTLGVVWRIHWQALRLWLKRAVFHSRPQPPLQETTR